MFSRRRPTQRAQKNERRGDEQNMHEAARVTGEEEARGGRVLTERPAVRTEATDKTTALCNNTRPFSF